MTLDAFKQRLREAYRRAGGQEAVEQRSRVAQTTLSYWAGPARKLPPSDRLARVAQACGVTVEWLLTGATPAPPSHDVDQRLLTTVIEEVERHLAGRRGGARRRVMIAADKAALIVKIYALVRQRRTDYGEDDIQTVVANLLLHE